MFLKFEFLNVFEKERVRAFLVCSLRYFRKRVCVSNGFLDEIQKEGRRFLTNSETK